MRIATPDAAIAGSPSSGLPDRNAPRIPKPAKSASTSMSASMPTRKIAPTMARFANCVLNPAKMCSSSKSPPRSSERHATMSPA